MKPPPLLHLYVNPSGECNLACMHCWITPRRSASPFSCRDRMQGEFSLEEFRTLLDQAAGLGLGNLKFTGGEPLLRNDFPELYLAAAEHSAGLVPDIETNGTLVPPGLWEAFRSHRPRSVAVSLDSTDPGVHDSFRNTPGAWKRTVAFIGELVDIGVNTQVIMSTADLEVGPVLDMAGFCRDSGVSSLKINPVQPMGRGLEIHRGAARVRDYIEFTREVLSACGRSVIPDVPPAFLPLHRLKDSGRCPIHNLLGVLPDGGISFCGIGFNCSELVMGNFISDGLEAIWKDHPRLRGIRELLPHRLEGICGNCMHKAGCLGSCVMQNYYSSGTFTAPFWMCAAAEAQGLFPETRKIDPDA